MFGIGKERTPYGDFLDKNQIKQERISEESGLHRETVSRACNDKDYSVRKSIKKLLTEAARKLSGKDVRQDDFWNV